MLVIDASVVVKLLVEEAGSERASDLVLAQERIAPDLIRLEVASALSKKVRYHGLPLSDAAEAYSMLLAFVPDQIDVNTLVPSALRLSVDLRHSLYDCTYLALAVQRDCRLLTADVKFFRAAEATGYAPRVELLRVD